jgi:hypothetical protein
MRRTGFAGRFRAREERSGGALVAVVLIVATVVWVGHLCFADGTDSNGTHQPVTAGVHQQAEPAPVPRRAFSAGDGPRSGWIHGGTRQRDAHMGAAGNDAPQIDGDADSNGSRDKEEEEVQGG